MDEYKEGLIEEIMSLQIKAEYLETNEFSISKDGLLEELGFLQDSITENMIKLAECARIVLNTKAKVQLTED